VTPCQRCPERAGVGHNAYVSDAPRTVAAGSTDEAAAAKQRPEASVTRKDSAGDSGSDDQVVSDEAMRKVFIGVGVVALVAVVVAVFVAGARWAADDTAPQQYGNADVGFLQDMIDHHGQAFLISNAYLQNNAEGDAASFAREVILIQEMEVDRMDNWLADAGFARGEPDRRAMAWMGMATAVADMPGMQDPARIAELGAARGADADRLFFQLMSEHHRGGADMAEAAAAGAQRDDIAAFAEKMAYNQRVEIVEYDQAMERFGL
jgi:uncharacterized protein (DUF305 family)